MSKILRKCICLHLCLSFFFKFSLSLLWERERKRGREGERKRKGMCVSVCMQAYECVNVCKQVYECHGLVTGRARIQVSGISSFLPLCVPGIKIRSSGLYGKHFYLMSHLISPEFKYMFAVISTVICRGMRNSESLYSWWALGRIPADKSFYCLRMHPELARGPEAKVLAAKPKDLSLISWIHTVTGDNQLPPAVCWPPHTRPGVCACSPHPYIKHEKQ